MTYWSPLAWLNLEHALWSLANDNLGPVSIWKVSKLKINDFVLSLLLAPIKMPWLEFIWVAHRPSDGNGISGPAVAPFSFTSSVLVAASPVPPITHKF